MVAANSINESTTGIVGFTGTSFTATPVTQYNVLVGGATTSTLTNVAPSATSGVPLISSGASANPAFGTMVVAGGGTGNTTFTAYSVICAGTTATGAFQSTGTGNSGEILTSQGASALPIYAAAGGSGSLVLIESLTATDDATLEFTTGITSYNSFFLTWKNVVPATDDANIVLRISLDGGSTWENTGYASGAFSRNFNAATLANFNSTSEIILCPKCSNTASDGPGNGHVFLHNFNGSNRGGFEGFSSNYRSIVVVDVIQSLLGGSFTGGADAIQILTDGGNITSGTFTLYGLVES